MKKSAFIPILCLCSIFVANAQDISLKYGKITNDELTMKVYDKDSSAVAVVLYTDGNASYDYSSTDGGFRIITNFSKKIKILKQDGLSFASISIPFHYEANGVKDRITDLEVIAYNLDEKGAIVKSKLDKKYIFEEDINNFAKQLKFSVPNVIVGTVIEYKYNHTSRMITNVPDWEIQSVIPVMNSKLEIAIPEYFIFNFDTKGFEHVEVKDSKKNQTFSLDSRNGVSIVNCVSRDLKFTAKDIPALKNENYVWCLRDFTSGVRFEFSATKFPYDSYRPISQTWADLEKTLTDKTDFSSNMNISNPFEAEIKVLVSNVKDKSEKVNLIYDFIKKRISWNQNYDFYGRNPKDCVKKGTGNNAQINIVLMAALKDAGIKSHPILISRRNFGRLPYTFPSLNKLNTFIVAAELSDSSVIYLDGSAVYGGPNVLPVDLLVDRAYVFEPTYSNKWVDLTNINKNDHKTYTQANINENGVIKGFTTNTLTNQIAYSFKSNLYSAKDSADYTEKIQNSGSMEVDSIFITGKDSSSNKVKEKIYFTKTVEKSGNFMYINPMVFSQLTKNEFTQANRKLPVEFLFPFTYTTICSLTIPDGYQVEELPKNMRLVLNNNQCSCTYQIAQSGNIIQLRYQFEINQTIFPSTDYTAISNFYGQIATKNTEMVVLKKKQS